MIGFKRSFRTLTIGLTLMTCVGTCALIRTDTVTLAASEQSSAEFESGWRLVRTPNPRGSPDAISIMRTADTSRSDLDLAGLMIRCNSGHTELAIVLLRAFPLRANPVVTLGQSGHERQFKATIGAPGTAVVITGDPKSNIGDEWQSEADLFIRVVDGPTSVSGVVALAGLQSAFKSLVASCAAL